MAIAAAGVLLVASFAGGAAAGPGKSTTPREGARSVAIADPAARFVPGEVLVRFRSGVSAAARTAALESQGAKRVRNLLVPGVVLAKLAPGKSVMAAVESFSKRTDVVYAEPNWIYRAAATPNDPRFANGELWGLNQLTDVDIDAPQAWDVTTGSSNVIVAVVDTGVAYDHPDLAPNIWVNNDPIDGIDNDANGFVDDVRGWDFFSSDNDPRDIEGHGSHVAGTIGAKGNNGVGVTGVNWNVTLMPVRVLGPGGGSNATVADGFAYAAANGAKVVNASLGCNGTNAQCFSQTMKNAIDAATGTLFVVAAGNDGTNNELSSSQTYPCNYTSANLICVAATTRTDGLANFSNFGTTSVDLGAPGTEIVSAWLGHDFLFTDGFETDTGWVGGGDPNTWTRTTETAVVGSWSATDSPGGNYPNDPDDIVAAQIDNWFQMPGSVNLSGRSNCGVRYLMNLDTEFDFDYFVIWASTDGTNWTEIAAWTGTSSGNWFEFEDSLSAFDGQPAVFLRFGLDTDDSVVFDGAHVDDVAVRCVSTNYTADSYNEIQGTSMATPHVAGVAALAWAKNPTVTVAQVRTALLNGGDTIASLIGTTVTGRRLNAVGTLSLVPPPPSLSINDVAVAEGNAGTSDATFTVTLSAASSATVTVNYQTANGTATAPGDYTTSSGTVTFAPGQVTRPITVPIVGDTAEEPTETFFVNLSGAVNAGISDAQGVGTINDNDVPAGSSGLTVSKGGTGFGRVTGTGVDCGTVCFNSYVTGTSVVLTATAGPGSVFASWTGCDVPSAATCTMNMTTTKSVTANFTATPTFIDVPPSNPFYNFIEQLFDLGITTGCNPPTNNMFCPGDFVPRQQMAAFLIRAKGLTQLFPATPSFTDVPASNPFFGYIERLKEQGITTGCNPPANNLFCPTDFVPRQQMAAFLIRAKGLTQLNPVTPSFLDVPASNPFFGYIERLREQAITTGCNPPANNLYCPVDNVPRQQMAAFLVRAFSTPLP